MTEEEKSRIRGKRLFLLDMDGTIYLDETLFDGTLDFLAAVKAAGGRYIFLTNNSSRGTEAYIEKMRRLGIAAVPEDFVTSADAAIEYLSENFGTERKMYVCGTESLKQMLRDAGFQVAEEPDADVEMVLLGYDTELNYKKLTDCCRLLNRGVRYAATHPDLVCPVSYGFAPDCGSVINMLETATGRRPLVIGKPEPAMPLLAMKRTGFSPEETAVVGDRLYTDVACGLNAGIDAVFVLSGEGVRSDIEKYRIQPSFVLENIRELCDIFTGRDGGKEPKA